MAGKFMQRTAVIGTIKGLEALNSRQKREHTNFAVRTVQCGCSDPGCGAFHSIDKDRPLPTTKEALNTLRQKKAEKRTAKKLKPATRRP